MIKYILLVCIALVTFVIAAISVYLSPDDLRSCKQPETSGLCASADAIVVVSGGDTNARVDEGIRLYKAGWGSKLIFSGAAADPKSPSNAEAMERRAITAGVPEDSIMIEKFSRTTAENAHNTAKFITDNSIHRIVLVTSAYHQRRALLEFKETLGSSVTVMSHPVSHDKQWAGLWWWTTPRGWWLAGGELVKIAYFYTSSDLHLPGDLR
jgi:uncharacterized SAM-binding protein YcdF (DUF218 family)